MHAPVDIGPRPSPGNPGPHPDPRRPGLALPPGATDAHCHVFGPVDRYPYSPARTFTPVAVPIEEVAARQAFLGLERAVIVQSACYGRDHRALLAALRADPARRRGAALLGPELTDADIAELDAAGVRGARMHIVSHLGRGPSPAERSGFFRRVADLGWHAEIHVEGSGIIEAAELISRAPGTVVIDHMARIDLANGEAQASLDALIRLLDLGHVWVKLSCVDRISREGPPYADAVALAAALVTRFPERVVWGTDFPHVNIVGDAPDDGLLVDLLERIAPNQERRRRLLVTNPEELFGFPPL